MDASRAFKLTQTFFKMEIGATKRLFHLHGDQNHKFFKYYFSFSKTKSDVEI